MKYAVPLTISDEAQEYVVEHGLQEPFQRMLDNIPVRMANVHAVEVSLTYSPCGNDPRVIMEVGREHPGGEYDPTDSDWTDWLIQEFPPEVFSHFCVLSYYV